MKALHLGIVVALSIIASTGCYRTRYVHLGSPSATSAPPASAPPQQTSSWRHFFLFGWVPDELRIDAARQCGGPEHVRAIETEQTFLQGLITMFASYYINIYAPWTARVVCDSEPPLRTPTTLDAPAASTTRNERKFHPDEIVDRAGPTSQHSGGCADPYPG